MASETKKCQHFETHEFLQFLSIQHSNDGLINKSEVNALHDNVIHTDIIVCRSNPIINSYTTFILYYYMNIE